MDNKSLGKQEASAPAERTGALSFENGQRLKHMHTVTLTTFHLATRNFLMDNNDFLLCVCRGIMRARFRKRKKSFCAFRTRERASSLFDASSQSEDNAREARNVSE